MTHGSSRHDRRDRHREIDREGGHHNRGPKGYFLWDDDIGADYIKTLYRSWERGLDTSVFRHDKSRERK